MHKPVLIPDKEPRLRVGIVLPEDNKRSLIAELPGDQAFEIQTDEGRTSIPDGGLLRFDFDENEGIKTRYGQSTGWSIRPLAVAKTHPGSGIKLLDIIAGRGFHWQKPVSIYLSGSLDIKVYEQRLILINELPMEDYLMCVATSEMGADCPSALIESQTIAARSWMLANREQKHIALGMDVCNDDCCQRYQGNENLTDHAIRGALNTAGQVLLYNNAICDARYSKSCGGIMESFSAVWNGDDLPYMRNIPDAPPGFSHTALPLSSEKQIRAWIDDVPDTFCSPHAIPESSLKRYLGSVDESGNYFRWHFSYTQQELRTLLNRKLNLNSRAILDLKPLNRGGSGRITKLEINYQSETGEKKSHLIDSEYRIRQALHPGFLYSSCFYIIQQPQPAPVPEQITLKGAGWGHGAGLCQIGALGMALADYNTRDILSHYYPGSELKKIYSTESA